MNWAAFLSFFHPMIVGVICGVWVLWILNKEYSQALKLKESQRDQKPGDISLRT